ncbi:MAG: lipase family protein [Betaproteobacteria bacterium]|nr:lipase family protein [Betaproteobacteria bacterium]
MTVTKIGIALAMAMLSLACTHVRAGGTVVVESSPSAAKSGAANSRDADNMFTLPPATIANTIPPALGRRYFEVGNAYRFPAAGKDFSLVRAWWLAEAALLAYADPPFAVEQFGSAGLTVDGGKAVSVGSTQAYVAFNDDIIIVVFRGTEVPKAGTDKTPERLLANSFRDVMADLKIPPKAAKPRGMAHGGFVDGWTAVSRTILGRIRDLKEKRPARSVWFTGHSLGAALAILAAAEYGAADGLYTYGSPPVGDAEFTAAVTSPAFRFVHNNDAVANAPLTYLHVGIEKYFDPNGSLTEPPALLARVATGVSDAVLSGLDALDFRDGLVFPRTPLTDHAPLYYALLARHAMEQENSGAR